MSHPIGRGRGAILPAWMSNANVDVPSLGSFGGRPSDNDNTFKERQRSRSNERPSNLDCTALVNKWTLYRSSPYNSRVEDDRRVLDIFSTNFDAQDRSRSRRLDKERIVSRLFCLGPDSVKQLLRFIPSGVDSDRFVLDVEFHDYPKNPETKICLYEAENGKLARAWIWSDDSISRFESSMSIDEAAKSSVNLNKALSTLEVRMGRPSSLKKIY